MFTKKVRRKAWFPLWWNKKRESKLIQFSYLGTSGSIFVDKAIILQISTLHLNKRKKYPLEIENCEIYEQTNKVLRYQRKYFC